MVAVTGVGISTAVFGLLPSVAQIGWAATVLFLVFRLIQGIFVGGVVASSHTIGTESVPERWRGLMSGAVGGGGSAVGGLLASLVFFVVTLIAPGDAVRRLGLAPDVLLRAFSPPLSACCCSATRRNRRFFKALAAKKALQTALPRRSSDRRSATLFSRPVPPDLLRQRAHDRWAQERAITSPPAICRRSSIWSITRRTTSSSMILIGANLAAAVGARVASANSASMSGARRSSLASACCGSSASRSCSSPWRAPAA